MLIIRKSKAVLRLVSLLMAAGTIACGGAGSSDSDTADDTVPGQNIISSDETLDTNSALERELLVSENSTNTTTVTQCFCTTEFTRTLKFYHFEEHNAVLLIEFDNQTRAFNSTVSLALFDVSENEETIGKWINNQHSDGLYFDAATPSETLELSPDSVKITSRSLIACLSGNFGDEYEQTAIEFSVANLSKPGVYFLNGFADQSVVYLQTR